MDSEIVPLECHQCFKYEQMMYIVESGFEVAYFKIGIGREYQMTRILLIGRFR